MPYVAPEEIASSGLIDLAAIGREMGAPPWRRPLVASGTTRWVLWAMPAGFQQPAHQHPRADEVFHVLEGHASFRFGEGRDHVAAGPGTILFAPRGVAHEIAVPGPETVIFIASVAPNEDAADETVEVPAP
jgi:mannose-6-phosphate isomerase-like protein (cupin superfamily)